MHTIRATYLKNCWSLYHQSLNLHETVIIAGHGCRETQLSATKEENNVALQQYGQTPCLNSDGRGSTTLCSNLHSHRAKTTSFIRYGKHCRKTKSVSYISHKVLLEEIR